MENEKMFNEVITDIEDKLTKNGVKLIRKGKTYALDTNNKRSVVIASILLDVAEMEQMINDCYKFVEGKKVGKFTMPLNNENITKMKKIIDEKEKELNIYLNELKQYEV